MTWKMTVHGLLTTLALWMVFAARGTSAGSSSKCSCKPHRLRCEPRQIVAVTDARHVYREASPANDDCLRRMAQSRTCPRKKDSCCQWNEQTDVARALSHSEAEQLHGECWGQAKCHFRVNASLARPGPPTHMTLPQISTLAWECLQGSDITTFASTRAVTSKRVMSSFVENSVADYFPVRHSQEAESTWLCNVTSRKTADVIVALANPHKPRLSTSAPCDVTLTAGTSYLPCGDIYLSFPATTPFNVTFHLARRHVPKAAYVVISANVDITLKCGEKLYADVTTSTTERAPSTIATSTSRSATSTSRSATSTSTTTSRSATSTSTTTSRSATSTISSSTATATATITTSSSTVTSSSTTPTTNAATISSSEVTSKKVMTSQKSLTEVTSAAGSGERLGNSSLLEPRETTTATPASTEVIPQMRRTSHTSGSAATSLLAWPVLAAVLACSLLSV